MCIDCIKVFSGFRGILQLRTADGILCTSSNRQLARTTSLVGYILSSCIQVLLQYVNTLECLDNEFSGTHTSIYHNDSRVRLNCFTHFLQGLRNNFHQPHSLHVLFQSFRSVEVKPFTACHAASILALIAE